MADVSATCQSEVIASLLDRGHGYSFVQVLRLLHVASGETPPAIVTAPELSLAFPAADVAKVERLPGKIPSHRVCVNFLGLYGASSPLPAFYTEELLDEAASDGSVRRDFLDIVHRRLYELNFECWCKYRIWHGVGDGDEALLERLFSLIGLAEPELRRGLGGVEPLELLRYTGLLGQFPRSASGLAALLRDALGGIPVAVVQCVARSVKIAPEQRLAVGRSCCTLGEDAVLGEEIADATGKFRLQIGPVGREAFEGLLPGGALNEKLSALVAFYLSQPLDYDVELILCRSDVETVRLGTPGSARLGLNSWCFAGTFTGDAQVRHEPGDAAQLIPALREGDIRGRVLPPVLPEVRPCDVSALRDLPRCESSSSV